MSALHNLLESLKSLYSTPIHTWTGQHCYNDSGYRECYNTDPDKLTAIVTGMMLVVGTLIVIAAICGIGYGLYKVYVWFRYRERCQHCSEYTLYKSGEFFAGCLLDKPCCDDCFVEHELASLPSRKCPIDDSMMIPRLFAGYYIYRCGDCGAHLLEDNDFPEIINEVIRTRGSNVVMMGGITAGVISTM